MADLVHHIGDDNLAGRGWLGLGPGVGRTPAPGGQAKALARDRVDLGAACPAE